MPHHRLSQFIKRALVAALVSVSFTALFVACSAGVRTPEQVLEEQVRTFHGHLRWGRVEEAASFVAPEHREVFLGMYDEYGEDYEVTEYEIENINYQRGAENAEVVVWMQWFRLPSTRVQDATYNETWEYNMLSRVWQLVGREADD
ncbi:MAG: hypothetical protein ACI81R_002712 [Bradymonadia bacterium]|jgi:hypothetical protein